MFSMSWIVLVRASERERAKGLEMSVLWVVRKPISDHEETKKMYEDLVDFDLDSVLPEGFRERTRDRGMVVKSWAPQVQLLKKEPVSGFLQVELGARSGGFWCFCDSVAALCRATHEHECFSERHCTRG